MLVFYKAKLTNLFESFFENKFISSKIFNIFCAIIYCQNINLFLNCIISIHLSIIVAMEVVNYAEAKRKQQLLNKNLLNIYKRQNLIKESSRFSE